MFRRGAAISTIALVIAVLVAGYVLSQIQKKSFELSGGFEKNKVISAAESAIQKMNDGSYEALMTMMSDSLKAQVSKEELATAADKVLAKAGPFQAFETASITGSTDDSTGTKYAISEIVVRYMNRTVTFTVSFNTDMQITGFYMK